MARSSRQIFGAIVAFIVLTPIVIGLSPVLALAGAWYLLRRAWLIARLRAIWPPNKFVLLAYTQSAAWAPFIEQSLLPQLGDAVVAIDRSKEDWKRSNPVEARAVSFWGGLRAHNPIAIVIRNRWRVRVFRFYEAFQQFKHGRPQDLELVVSEFLSHVKEVARASA
jgi:hypothetical protein